MDPLERMHEYAWLDVLRRADSRDKKALSGSCHYFRDLLQREECTWTFDDVLPFLWSYLTKSGDPANPIDAQAVLNCRVVCNSWTDSIDRHISDYLTEEDAATGKILSNNVLLNPESITRFQERFTPIVRNPFVGRSALLMVVPSEENAVPGCEPFRAAMSLKQFEFLEQFGSHLWNVSIHVRGVVLPLSHYHLLRRILTHLPNLRLLAIQLSPEFEHSRQSSWPWPVGTGTPELNEFIQQNPLPEMPYLEYLYGNVAPVCEKYSSQLEHLNLSQATFFTPNLAERFRNLVALELEIVDPSSSLPQFRSLQSPLEKLSIRFQDIGSILWPVDEFLRNVEHLTNLERLEISGRGLLIAERDAIPPTLRLESIHHIHLNIDSEDKSTIFWNFLLALPNLQTVYVNLNYLLGWTLSPHPLGFPDRVQVKEHILQNMYESNIWEMVPSLQIFEVKYHLVTMHLEPHFQRNEPVYRRQEYEMRLRQPNL